MAKYFKSARKIFFLHINYFEITAVKDQWCGAKRIIVLVVILLSVLVFNCYFFFFSSFYCSWFFQPCYSTDLKFKMSMKTRKLKKFHCREELLSHKPLPLRLNSWPETIFLSRTNFACVNCVVGSLAGKLSVMVIANFATSTGDNTCSRRSKTALMLCSRAIYR